jgi:hypothetical protein
VPSSGTPLQALASGGWPGRTPSPSRPSRCKHGRRHPAPAARYRGIANDVGNRHHTIVTARAYSGVRMANPVCSRAATLLGQTEIPICRSVRPAGQPSPGNACALADLVPQPPALICRRQIARARLTRPGGKQSEPQLTIVLVTVLHVAAFVVMIMIRLRRDEADGTTAERAKVRPLCASHLPQPTAKPLSLRWLAVPRPSPDRSQRPGRTAGWLVLRPIRHNE